METRSRKRTRVTDYDNNDAVVERAAKRVKKEKNVKQEIKKEPKIKLESKNVKKENKITVKSEIKSEVKIELKKEKKEKKIKLETKHKIKKEPGVTEETTDQAEESIEKIDEDVDESGSSESKEVVEISDESERISEEEKDEEESKGDDKAKFNFKQFKTIVLSGNGLRWRNPKDQPQMKFNTNIIENIMSVSAVPQIMIWARVSKLTSNLVHGSQSLWQKLFREYNWRLPHEIRNHNFKFRTEGGDATEPIPPLKIADKKVDWFSEFKRNYTTRSEIKKLATYLCKHYTGGEPVKGDEDERMTEEDLLEWEEENNYYVPNDYRDYCKICWTSLTIPYITHIETICGPDMSLSRLYRIEDDEDGSANDDWVNENYPNDSDTPGRPDLDSISKLMDIPKKKLKADIAGLLFLDAPTHYTFEIYVPYVNMIFEDQGELVGGKTILEQLKKLKKEVTQKKRKKAKK